MSTDWQSFRTLHLLQHLQNLLAHVLRNSCESTIWLGHQGSTWITAIEIQETSSDLILQIQIPEISAEDLDIEVTQETAVIKGRHRQADVEGYFHADRFQSIIPFPVPTHPEAVRVEVQDHQLRLVLPKSGSTQRQSVKVRPCRKPIASTPHDNQVEAY